MTTVGLHVDQAFYRVPGGIGTYVRELTRALPGADPALRLSLFHARFPAAPPSWMNGLDRHELPHSIARMYPMWALAGIPRLPAALADLDVLHAASPVAVPPARRGQRLVVTVHDLSFAVAPDLFPRRWRTLFRLGLRRAASRADAIIAVSRHTARDLTDLTRVPPERVRIVPLAVRLPAQTDDGDRVLERLRVQGPYVLFVGTLEPRKNLVRLVNAYRRAVERSGIEHALVLAGPWGWGSDPLRRELAREGPGRISVTGAVSEPELDALYRGAGLFVYPSIYEGFGLPVLEAMARGVPSVATASSSVPEVTADAAVLVDPLSTSELEGAIVRVLGDRGERARLAHAGAERAREFSWERTARETAAIYRSVA